MEFHNICDFFVSVTSSFRVLYVFIAMEIGSRRILHCNVPEHPTAEWTIQQFREFLAYDHRYRFLIHDRDTIFSSYLDSELQGFGVRVLEQNEWLPVILHHFDSLHLELFARSTLRYRDESSRRHVRFQ